MSDRDVAPANASIGWGRLIAVSVAIGVLTAVVCVVVMRLLGFEGSGAVAGGVSGAVTATTAGILARRSKKD